MWYESNLSLQKCNNNHILLQWFNKYTLYNNQFDIEPVSGLTFYRQAKMLHNAFEDPVERII